MNAFGIALAWLAAQITAVTLLAVVVLACTCRRGARSVVTVLAAVLCLLVALSALALVPLPDTWRWSPAAPEFHESRAGAAAAGTNSNEIEAARTGNVGSPRLDVFAWLRSLHELSNTQATWHWGAFAGIYLVGAALEALRLLLGWRALTRLRRDSRTIHDLAMTPLVAEICQELDCQAPVELRETDEAGLTATLGWRQPIILLPPAWRRWSMAECRVVIAHELAHVCHRDFALGLLAGLCRLLHFYHPLVRWLTAHFRWRQEVAADDLAAPLAGGRTAYLKVLARLALEAPARTSAWAPLTVPAMNGGALLRRILMLRQTNRRPLTGVARGALIALFAGLAMFVSVWRGPAQTTPAAAGTVQPFDLGYVAPEVKAVVAIRPSEILAQPGMEQMARNLEEFKLGELALPGAFKPKNIEQVVANLQIDSDGTGKERSRQIMIGTSSVLVRFHKELDGLELLRPWLRFLNPAGGAIKDTRVGNLVIHRIGVIRMLGPLPISMFMPDGRTMVFVSSKDDEAVVAAVRRVKAARERDWGSGRAKVELAPIAMLFDNSDNNYGKRHAKDLEAAPAVKSVLDAVRFAAVGIELGDGRPVRVVIDGQSAQATRDIERTVEQLLRLGMVYLKQSTATRPADKLARELIETHKVRTDGTSQEWLGYSTVRIHQLLHEPLLPK